MDIFEISKVIGIIIIGIGIGQFFPSYFREKGKNLATKEDISDITKQVEGIRLDKQKDFEKLQQENRFLLEQAKLKYQLSMVALDKRLEVHQQAYTLWHALLHAVHDVNRMHEVVIECQEWWISHCLYLDEKSRKAFKAALTAASIHKSLLEPPRAKSEVLRNNWNTVIEAGNAIVRGVELPSLGKEELFVNETDS